MSSTTNNPHIGRFERRERTWERVPGVPQATNSSAASATEGEITVTGEHLRPNLRGTFFPDAIFQATLLMTIVFLSSWQSSTSHPLPSEHQLSRSTKSYTFPARRGTSTSCSSSWNGRKALFLFPSLRSIYLLSVSLHCYSCPSMIEIRATALPSGL